MGWTTKILDLLYPPKCPFCDASVKEVTHAPCPACREADFWIRGPQAVFSGAAFSQCVAVGWYMEGLRESVQRFKFGGHKEYARAYGPLLARQAALHLSGEYDLLSWVPVSETRRRERGYDQAQVLAREMGKALGLPPVALLEKVRENKAQSALRQGSSRRANVAGVYAVPDPALVRGKRVLLVDDILTTGATLEEAARTLRQAGAGQVLGAVFCRTPGQKF